MADRFGKRAVGLAATTITTALTGTLGTVLSMAAAKYLVANAILTYGSGGTTVNVYIQTSLDNGATWIDIMNFSFTTASGNKVSAVSANTALAAAGTPVDGSLASNTILSGLLGDQFRVKVITTGTYAGGTSLVVNLVAKG